MALTRKMQIDSIIESHTETVNGLKDEIDELKDGAANTRQKKSEPKTGKKSGAGKESGEEGEDENPWEKKFKDLQKEMEDLKAKQAAKDARQAKENAFRKLLEDIGVSEKRRNAVVKVSDIDSVELDDKGGIKDADKLKESLKTEWADFIESKQTQGSNTPTPPSGNGGEVKSANPKAAEIAARYYANLYGTPVNQGAANTPGNAPENKKE